MRFLEALKVSLMIIALAVSLSEAKRRYRFRGYTNPRHVRTSLTATLAMPEGILDKVHSLEQGEVKPPIVFKNRQELMSYLKKLNEYYGIVGRPRFGKRTLESIDLDSDEVDGGYQDGDVESMAFDEPSEQVAKLKRLFI